MFLSAARLAIHFRKLSSVTVRHWKIADEISCRVLVLTVPTGSDLFILCGAPKTIITRRSTDGPPCFPPNLQDMSVKLLWPNAIIKCTRCGRVTISIQFCGKWFMYAVAHGLKMQIVCRQHDRDVYYTWLRGSYSPTSITQILADFFCLKMKANVFAYKAWSQRV